MDKLLLFQLGTSLSFINRVQDILNQDLDYFFNTIYSTFIYLNKPIISIEKDKGRVFISSGSIYIYLDKGYIVNFSSTYVPLRGSSSIIGIKIKHLELEAGDPQLEDIPFSSIKGSNKYYLESKLDSYLSPVDVIPLAFIVNEELVFVSDKYSNIQSLIYQYWTSIYGFYISKGFNYVTKGNQIKISPGEAYINKLVRVPKPTILELKPGVITLDSLGNIDYSVESYIDIQEIEPIYIDSNEVIDTNRNLLIQIQPIEAFINPLNIESLTLFTIDSELNISASINRVVSLVDLKSRIDNNQQLINKYLNLTSLVKPISIVRKNLIVESSISTLSSDPYHPESRFVITSNQALPRIDTQAIALRDFTTINTYRSNGYIIPLHNKEEIIYPSNIETFTLQPLSKLLLLYIRTLDSTLGLYRLEIISSSGIELDRSIVQSLEIGSFTSFTTGNIYNPDSIGRLSINIKTLKTHILINTHIVELSKEHHLLEKDGLVLIKPIQELISNTENYCWITNNKDTLEPISIHLGDELSKIVNANNCYLVKYSLINQTSIGVYTALGRTYYQHGSSLLTISGKDLIVSYSKVKLPISKTSLFIDLQKEYNINYIDWNLYKEGSLSFKYLVDNKEVVVTNKTLQVPTRRLRVELNIESFSLVKENSSLYIGQSTDIGVYISRTYEVSIYRKVEIIIEGEVSNVYISSNEGQTWDELDTKDNINFYIDNLSDLVNKEQGDNSITLIERKTIKLKIDIKILKGYSIYLY